MSKNKKKKNLNSGKEIIGTRKERWDYYNLGERWSDSQHQRDLRWFKKNEVWPAGKEQYEKIADKIDKRTAWIVKKTFDSIPSHLGEITKSQKIVMNEDREKYKNYVQTLKDAVDSMETPEDITNLLEAVRSFKGNDEYYGYNVGKTEAQITGRLGKDLNIEREMKRAAFLGDERDRKIKQSRFVDASTLKKIGETSEAKFYEGTEIIGSMTAKVRASFENEPPKKGILVYERITKNQASLIGVAENLEKAKNLFYDHEMKKPKKEVPGWKQLTNVQRNNMRDVRHGRNISVDELRRTFGFAGINRGTTMPNKEFKKNLNLAYDAFYDLAETLGIDKKDIGFNGKLSLSFGGRGSGKAMAHFEPSNNVINLTREKGAGTFSHEWFHALDHYIADKGDDYGTESLTGILHDTVSKVMYKEDGSDVSDYYINSKKADNILNSKKTYWSKTSEMTARAFACYMTDKCEGRSDYLNGHAETCTYRKMPLYPVGSEREAINKSFDNVFDYLKEKNILHPYDYSKDYTDEKTRKISYAEEKIPVRKIGRQMTIDDFLKENDR